MAYALAWCGWEVEPIDWLINEKHDVSDRKVQRAVATQMGKCDAAIWAADCSTFSRAREITIPGHKHGPKPLRTEGLPRGLQALQNRDADRVEKANHLFMISHLNRLRFQSLLAEQQCSSRLPKATCGISSS